MPESKSTTVGTTTLELVVGDITEQSVDAIVNAANSSLAGGGGVDGAIHRAGGRTIMQETDRRYPDGCPTGSAVISGAGEMPCRFVIHAVGPRWSGGQKGEPELLRGAYRTSLELAAENRCQSIALPAISAGIYGYPLDQAARIAIEEAADFARQSPLPSIIRFVLFNESVYAAFCDALDEVSSQ